MTKTKKTSSKKKTAPTKNSEPEINKKPSNKEIKKTWLSKKLYESELARLQYELVKMQYWIKQTGYRLVITFDGRDAAGKGGIIKRIMEPLNPRGVRLVALPVPSDRERTQWFFQRYIDHFPAAGEIVIFDRSWYNRASVERVMDFCTDAEYWDFLRSAPQFERMIVNSGIKLIKYWLSVSEEEQERRFQQRANDPKRRWKLSKMDLEFRQKWVDFSKAKDIMVEHTDIPEARWYQIEADDKRRARLNCIRHILDQVPYKDVIPPVIKLPTRTAIKDYVRPPRQSHIVVDDYYSKETAEHD